MLFTISQISELLSKAPKTIYRAHKQHNIGKLYEVAEGRRLLFTEEEVTYLEDVIFADNKREKLLANESVREIIKILKETPMTVYDLSRKTHLSKGTLQSYIMSMSSAFVNFAEDDSGVLYFTNYIIPDSNPSALERRVYYSFTSKKYVFWETHSNIPLDSTNQYFLVATDKCMYMLDSEGKMAYENDIILYNNERRVIDDKVQGSFIIVSNTYEEKE